MGQHIILLSDFSPKGSGYLSIMSNVAVGLVDAGYDVKVLGLEYRGEEHNYPFSLIPCRDMRDAEIMVRNLDHLWGLDLLLVGMDIPQQIYLLDKLSERKFKYVAITPVENPPVCTEWAIGLFPADHIFCISQIGTDALQKASLPRVSHLVVGISEQWHPISNAEREQARKLLGFTEDMFVIFANADNQERKNFDGMFEAVGLMKADVPNMKIRLVLVTRENNPYGWKVRSLANAYNMSDELIVFERGMTQDQLRLFYNVSDVFFQTSKAEGLGMPVLEAMQCGCPVVATDTGAMTELLEAGRGHLVSPVFTIKYDVWGNSKRDFISPDFAADALWNVYESGGSDTVIPALEYMKTRSIDGMKKQVVDKVVELC